MTLHPFVALRPATCELAARIASLPYDVISTAEAQALASGNPDSFLNVVRPEIQFPADCDPHPDAVYRAARTALDRLVREERLVEEAGPCLYLYRQTRGDHNQTAVVACCAVEDYANGTIRRHEKTRRDKEDDRTRHILETDANTGQVFLTYRDQPEIDARVATETALPPLYDFTAEDAVRHTVWRCGTPAALLAAFDAVPRAYIADGHHRSAASYRAGIARRDANPNHTGKEEYNAFMACLFPASQLLLLPYNRLVCDLHGRDAGSFLAAVRERFHVEPADASTPSAPRSCRLYCAGRWHRLSWDVPVGGESPAARLDVSVLQERLLAPLLGIDDPRTNPRIAFVGGVRGLTALTEPVDRGEAAVAFAMHPTTVNEMMEIADADAIMPPKSTWFEPKLRSGLLIHRL